MNSTIHASIMLVPVPADLCFDGIINTSMVRRGVLGSAILIGGYHIWAGGYVGSRPAVAVEGTVDDGR